MVTKRLINGISERVESAVTRINMMVKEGEPITPKALGEIVNRDLSRALRDLEYAQQVAD